MFNGFVRSYQKLVDSCPSTSYVTPAEMESDPLLGMTTSIVNTLGKDVFAIRWPHVQVRWGIEHDEVPNAGVHRAADGYAHVVLTTGACSLLASLGTFVSDGEWLTQVAYPRLIDQTPPPSFNQTAGEIAHLLGLAALFGHELGHVVDRHYVKTDSNQDVDVLVAEEISADGHAILTGLTIVEAWAADIASQGTLSNSDLRRLGACLLVLANAVIDHVEFGAPWQPARGQTHPPGVQRLIAACVHVNEHFKGLEQGFGVSAFTAVIAALSAFGIYSGPIDDEALVQMIENYDAKAVEIQFSALQKTLAERDV